MADKKHLRKKIVVDAEFQFRYLMTWVGLTASLVAGLVIALASVYYLFRGSGSMSLHLIWVSAVCAVVIAAPSVYYIMLHSHRIAGPAYRLTRLLKEAAEGRRGFRVRLRRKDYLTQIASSMNELLDSIERNEARIHELGKMVAELSENGQDIEHVHKVAREVSSRIAELVPLPEEVAEDGQEA